MTDEPRPPMDRQKAIALLREALDRLERPSANANGGALMMGGVYWRLETVLREYADRELDAHEGAEHAAFIRGKAPVTPPATVAALVEALEGMLNLDTRQEVINEPVAADTIRAAAASALAAYREAGR